MTAEQITILSNSLHGELLLPGNAAYESARKIFNGMINKKPAAFAQCRNAADIIACVNFARRNNILLAIKGGGHNAAGLGLCNDGLVIDLQK